MCVRVLVWVGAMVLDNLWVILIAASLFHIALWRCCFSKVIVNCLGGCCQTDHTNTGRRKLLEVKAQMLNARGTWVTAVKVIEHLRRVWKGNISLSSAVILSTQTLFLLYGWIDGPFSLSCPYCKAIPQISSHIGQRLQGRVLVERDVEPLTVRPTGIKRCPLKQASRL